MDEIGMLERELQDVVTSEGGVGNGRFSVHLHMTTPVRCIFSRRQPILPEMFTFIIIGSLTFLLVNFWTSRGIGVVGPPPPPGMSRHQLAPLE